MAKAWVLQYLSVGLQALAQNFLTVGQEKQLGAASILGLAEALVVEG